jgi:hypothetical protein
MIAGRPSSARRNFRSTTAASLAIGYRLLAMRVALEDFFLVEAGVFANRSKSPADAEF